MFSASRFDVTRNSYHLLISYVLLFENSNSARHENFSCKSSIVSRSHNAPKGGTISLLISYILLFENSNYGDREKFYRKSEFILGSHDARGGGMRNRTTSWYAVILLEISNLWQGEIFYPKRFRNRDDMTCEDVLWIRTRIKNI